MKTPGRHRSAKCKRQAAMVAAGLLVASCMVVGCTSRISTVNGRPDHYYGKALSLRGRIGEIVVRSDTGHAHLFHLVSKGGHRIMVFAPAPVAFSVGDLVSVRGEFVEVLSLAGRNYYDVVSATAVKKPGRLSRISFF